MKVIKPITAVCPSEDEMAKEIELAYLESRLSRLSNDELLKLVVAKLERDGDGDYDFINDLAKHFGYFLE